MKCENYIEEQEECRYFEAMHGSNEDRPSGMEVMSGRCKPFDDASDWYDVEPEDCDMLDFD